MAILKLLISLCIIIAAVAFSDEIWTDEAQTAIKYPLSDNIKPNYYNIELILPIEEDIYRGESNINIDIYGETQHIELHLVNLVVIEATLVINKDELQDSKNNIKKSAYKPIQYSYTHETNIFMIYFNDKILPGNYNLSIEFLGKATNNTKGLFRTSYKNDEGNTIWLFATYLQKTGARYLFPCWDEPKLEAKFTIAVKYPQKYTALSNMPIRNEYNVENGMKWTHFKSTPIMSPHLVAIAIIGYKRKTKLWDDIGTPNSHYSKLWFREKIIYKLFTYYNFISFTFNLQHNWNMSDLSIIPKVDYIAIPDFPEKVMATWGLAVYREADIFYEPNNVDITSRIKMEYLIARNMINEYLIDIPSYLKEEFGSFALAYTYDKMYKNSRRMDLLVVENQHESLRLNFYFNRNFLQTSKLLEINSIPSFRYNNVIPILRMLQHLLTENVFQKGMSMYLKLKHFTKPKDFWQSMEKTLNEWDKENKCNLTEKMNGWMNHKNYPILKIIPNYAGCINISLENFDSVDSNKYNLWIPITYTTQKNPDFDKTSYRDVMWFSTSQKILCIDELKYFEMNDWIIINLQQAGYYRVNYDTENWNKIAKYLNSMEYTNIHVLNRAQIIDDAYHFLTTGQIDSSIFWKLANYLPQDKDYIAWYPMIKAIEYMSSVFPLPDRRVYNLKTKIRNILDELLQNIGYDENITDHYFTNYLRQEAAKWSCVLGNPNCQQTATSKLQQHLENRTINKLLPWWEEWTYCNGLAMSGDTTWNNVFKIHTKESNDKYLKFLSCSENINIIQNYIKLMISEKYNGKKITDKDRLHSFHSIISKHTKNNSMLDFISSHFEKMPKEISKAAALIEIINHVYSEEHLDAIRKFAKNFAKELISDVERKIEKRLSEIKDQMNYLQILTN